MLSLSCITLLHEALHQASRKKELSVLFCTIYVFKLLKFLEHTPHNYGIQKYCDQNKSVRVSMQVTNPALATVDVTQENVLAAAGTTKTLFLSSYNLKWISQDIN